MKRQKVVFIFLLLPIVSVLVLWGQNCSRAFNVSIETQKSATELEPSLISDKNQLSPDKIRSVTYYQINYNFDKPEVFSNDLDKIKSLGFNTVWLVIPWMKIEPDVGNSPAEQIKINTSFTNNIKEYLNIIKTKNMYGIWGIAYYGLGWSPKGGVSGKSPIIDEMTFKYYTRYTKFVLTFLKEYNFNNVFLMFFTEGCTDPLPEDYKNFPDPDESAHKLFRVWLKTQNSDLLYWNNRWGTAFENWENVKIIRQTPSGYHATRYEDHRKYAMLRYRKTLSSHAFLSDLKKINPDIQIGFHDWTFKMEDAPWRWENSLFEPIETISDFAFTSAPAYDEKTQEAIVQRLEKVYPQTKHIIGEFGKPTCTPKKDAAGKDLCIYSKPLEEEQVTYYKKALALFVKHKFGFNQWNYRDFLFQNGQAWPNHQGHLGLFFADGTPKLAVNEIQKILTKIIISGAGINTAYNPWAVWLVFQNLLNENEYKIKIFDKNKTFLREYDKTFIKIATDRTWISFPLTEDESSPDWWKGKNSLIYIQVKALVGGQESELFPIQIKSPLQ